MDRIRRACLLGVSSCLHSRSRALCEGGLGTAWNQSCGVKERKGEFLNPELSSLYTAVIPVGVRSGKGLIAASQNW